MNALLQGDLIEQAAAAGMRSVFVGFETLDPGNLAAHGKRQNLSHDYDAAIRRTHDAGVMINGSFVFGLDHDGPDVFDRTVDWAVSRGVETATFHIMTPYPGTALHKRVEADGRLLHREWNLYDTRHVVYRPRLLTPGQLERGYARAYKQFYRWRNVWQSSSRQPTQRQRARHVAYAGGWKHFEPAWDMLIRSRHVSAALPMLEATLAAFGGRPSRRSSPAGVRPRPIG